MNTFYAKNGLVFLSENEIRLRQMVESYALLSLTTVLKEANRAFEFHQVEAPILTPREYINPNYVNDDMFVTADNLVLRPETTMGSYVAAKALLDPYNKRKVKLPIVVWQHGKSFRREQDQPLNHMRLKEFYQLEFQILFSEDTKMDYSTVVIPAVQQCLSKLTGPCRVEPSDRIPDYALWTQDIVHEARNMEICSISRRKDFECAVLEVAIGTDRCMSLM